jgi:DNA-binding transcriptional MerR regulator
MGVPRRPEFIGPSRARRWLRVTSLRKLANLPMRSSSGGRREDRVDASVRDRGEQDAGVEIGAVCEQTGLSARTVRYYEELGLLPGVRRRAGGRRVYGRDELERLRFIQRLKALGLSLAEVKELNSIYAIGGSTRAMLERLADQLDERLGELDARIEELQHLRDEMGKYREHVASRTAALADASQENGS